ncbi:exopolyphosphatase [Ornithinibacillus sp. 179-J 7C1 HS]|uniref:Ppx/GppA phosphatase family protein n=1 Tax=Ornithinibacillus sp. 179-J 7C1 HS TaxID=3142384 RepID=UPI00399F97EA
MAERVGIIDIGSNTIRLVIYERLTSWQHFDEIENIKVSARLRSYFDENHFLNNDGIELLIKTLEDFNNLLTHYEVNEFTCVATASIRQAANKNDILKIVEKKTKIAIKLLSEYEEAFYGFKAVIHSIPLQQGLTIDIGGGSTEVTYFENRNMVHFHSFPFGALSLKLQFVKQDIPSYQEIENIRHFIDEQLQKFPWISNKQVPVIAIGGSARNVGQIHQLFSDYPLDEMHQYEMEVEDLTAIKERLLPLSYPELQKIDGLSKDRVDTILPAFEVFEAICKTASATKYIVSRRGLRDGILYEKWLNHDNHNLPLLDVSIEKFRKHFYIGSQDEHQLTKIATIFYEAVKKIDRLGHSFSKEDYKLLVLGARIYNLGNKVSTETSSNTFTLIANQTILGMSHRDRIKLALVASYKGKGAFQKYIQPYKDWYTKEEQIKISILGAILKVSQSLNISNKNTVVDVHINQEKADNWSLNISCNGYFRPEEYHVEKQKKHLEKLLKISISTSFFIS